MRWDPASGWLPSGREQLRPPSQRSGPRRAWRLDGPAKDPGRQFRPGGPRFSVSAHHPALREVVGVQVVALPQLPQRRDQRGAGLVEEQHEVLGRGCRPAALAQAPPRSGRAASGRPELGGRGRRSGGARCGSPGRRPRVRESVEYLRVLRVRSAPSLPTDSRWLRSAQGRQGGWPSSSTKKRPFPSSPPLAERCGSLNGRKATTSGLRGRAGRRAECGLPSVPRYSTDAALDGGLPGFGLRSQSPTTDGLPAAAGRQGLC